MSAFNRIAASSQRTHPGQIPDVVIPSISQIAWSLKRWTEVHSTYRTHFVMNIFIGLLALNAPYERTFHIYAPTRNSFVQGRETKGQIAFTQSWNHDIITWLTQTTEEPTAEDQWCVTEKFGGFRFSYHVAYRQLSQKRFEQISECSDLTWPLYTV